MYAYVYIIIFRDMIVTKSQKKGKYSSLIRQDANNSSHGRASAVDRVSVLCVSGELARRPELYFESC